MLKPEELLHTTMRESCDRLLESLQTNVLLAVGRAPPSELDGRELASWIGFTGIYVRGSITVRAPVSFFAGTFPVTKAKGDKLEPREICDWAGEIANQLLGRLKNKLLSYGVSLAISTPAILFGDSLREPDPQPCSLALRFPWQAGEVFIRFDVETEPGFQILEEPCDCAPMEAGDALLF
jgi:chemotaxis protein CheX